MFVLSSRVVLLGLAVWLLAGLGRGYDPRAQSNRMHKCVVCLGVYIRAGTSARPACARVGYRHVRVWVKPVCRVMVTAGINARPTVFVGHFLIR